MSADSLLLRGVLLALSLLAAGYTQGIRPSLNLFASEGNEETFYFVVGKGQRTVSLITNPNVSTFLNDPDSNITTVVFVIQGIHSREEKLFFSLAPGFVSIVTAESYSFGRSTKQSPPSDFSFLSSVKYVANLSLSAVSELPRNISVTAYDAIGGSIPALIHLVAIPPLMSPLVFSAPSYSTTLLQNTTNGVAVAVTISAMDPDGRPVRYSIQQSTLDAFSIDPLTGVILINRPSAVNSATAGTVYLNVLATSVPLTEDPPKTATATLNITLLHAPFFKQSYYNFSTPSVGRVFADDLDGDVLTYSLASPQSNIEINSTTGEISWTSGLLTPFSSTFVVLVTDNVYVAGVSVTFNVIPVVGALITPASSTVNILLDTKKYGVYLSNSETPLVVQDTAANLVRGTASLTAQLYGGATIAFPLPSGCCECAPSCGSVFALCNTSFDYSYNLFQDATSGGPTPSTTTCSGDTVYNFNGVNNFVNNLVVASSLRSNLLAITNSFTISMWIQVYPPGSSYLLAFEETTSNRRHFHLYDKSLTQFAVFYTRAAIPGATNDNSIGSEVEVDFTYNNVSRPMGMRDTQWHYISISVNYPNMQFTLDGEVYDISEYSYTNQNGAKVPSTGLAMGNIMPAPILDKSGSSNFNVYIGGSTRRSPGYTVRGSIRQIYFTSLMNTETYHCLASCNNKIYTDGHVPQITTSYNPVSRTLSFNGTNSPLVYTNFLQSLFYVDNGYLPPQETGSTRIITMQISDAAATPATGVATVTITGLSNQFLPMLDANGNLVDGINFNAVLTEGSNPSTPIYDQRVFIYDQDINPYLAWVNVTILNPLKQESEEYLTLTQNPPSTLSVVGKGTHTIILTSKSMLATNTDFIEALLSIVYVIPYEALGGSRTIQSTIYDGKYVNQPPAYTYVTVVAIDDPPVLTFPTGLISYVEGSLPTYIARNVTVQDTDNTILASASIELGHVFDVSYEYLSIDLSAAPGVTCSLTPCSGPTLTIMGNMTVEGYAQLLRTLQYVNLLSSNANLRNRNVSVTLSDGELQGTAFVIIQVLPSGQRTVLELDAPNQNYSTNFTLGHPTSVPVVGAVRVVDSTVTTLQSVVVSLRNPLPDEVLTLSSYLDVPLAIEINYILKRISFSIVADVSIYLQVLSTVRYFNNGHEPLSCSRYVDFLVDPGGGAPLFSATTDINVTIAEFVTLITSVPSFGTSSQLLTSVPTFATSSQLLTSRPSFDTTSRLLTSVPSLETSSPLLTSVPSFTTSSWLVTSTSSIATLSQLLNSKPSLATLSQLLNSTSSLATSSQLLYSTPSLATSSQLLNSTSSLATLSQLLYSTPSLATLSQLLYSTPSLATSSQLLYSTPSLATSSQLLYSTPSLATSSQLLYSTPSLATSSQLLNSTPSLATSSQLLYSTSSPATSSQLFTSDPTFATSSQPVTSLPSFGTSSQLLTSVPSFATSSQLVIFAPTFVTSSSGLLSPSSTVNKMSPITSPVEMPTSLSQIPSIVIALGIIIAVLVLVLIVVIGAVCTCVFIKRRLKGHLEINTLNKDPTYEMVTHPGTTMLPCEAYGVILQTEMLGMDDNSAYEVMKRQSPQVVIARPLDDYEIMQTPAFESDCM